MKKIFLLVCIVVLSMNVFGQKAGERYVSPCFSASFGLAHYTYYQYNTLQRETELGNVYLSPGVEWGKFFTDKIRLSIYLETPMTILTEEEELVFGSLLSPNMGIYFPITEKLSYAPEIGFGGEWGYYYRKAFGQLSVYLNLLVFEFRVKENISIAMHVGEIGYSYTNYFRYGATTQQFYCNLNQGMISVRFYY